MWLLSVTGSSCLSVPALSLTLHLTRAETTEPGSDLSSTVENSNKIISLKCIPRELGLTTPRFAPVSLLALPLTSTQSPKRRCCSLSRRHIVEHLLTRMQQE